MPSVPTRYPSTPPPSRDNEHLNSLDAMSSDETLEDSSMSSLTITLPISSTSMNSMAKRPPLPPNYNHHKKLSSRILPVGNSYSIMRSPSPCSVSSSVSYRTRSGMRSPSVASLRSCPRSQLDSPTFSIPPRRTYPRESTRSPSVENVLIKEQAPVVFDASLNFVLGCERQKVKQSFRPTASHLEPSTASSYLSSKISQFLKRTDHIMDEWRSLGHSNEADDDAISVPNTLRNKSRGIARRSQSATNIMIRGYQYYSNSRSNSITKSPSRRSMSRGSEDATLSDGIQEVT